MLCQLSYGPLIFSFVLSNRCRRDGQGRSRTADTAIFSRVLYQLSYLAPEKKPAWASGLRRVVEGADR